MKTSPKARRSLKLSDVEDTVVKGEKEKKTQKKKIVPQASPTMERAGSTRTTPKRAAATDARKKFEQQQRNGGFESDDDVVFGNDDDDVDDDGSTKISRGKKRGKRQTPTKKKNNRRTNDSSDDDFNHDDDGEEDYEEEILVKKRSPSKNLTPTKRRRPGKSDPPTPQSRYVSIFSPFVRTHVYTSHSFQFSNISEENRRRKIPFDVRLLERLDFARENVFNVQFHSKELFRSVGNLIERKQRRFSSRTHRRYTQRSMTHLLQKFFHLWNFGCQIVKHCCRLRNHR